MCIREFLTAYPTKLIPTKQASHVVAALFFLDWGFTLRALLNYKPIIHK